MCFVCGTPDPSHDLLLLRAVVLTSGAGVIFAPRELRDRLAQRLKRRPDSVSETYAVGTETPIERR